MDVYRCRESEKPRRTLPTAMRGVVLLFALAGLAATSKVVFVDVLMVGDRDRQAAAVLRERSAPLKERVDAVWVRHRSARQAILDLQMAANSDEDLSPHVRNVLLSLREQLEK